MGARYGQIRSRFSTVEEVNVPLLTHRDWSIIRGLTVDIPCGNFGETSRVDLWSGAGYGGM